MGKPKLKIQPQKNNALTDLQEALNNMTRERNTISRELKMAQEARNLRLTAKAFKRLVVERGKTSIDLAESLRQALLKGKQGFAHARLSFQTIAKNFKDGHVPRPPEADRGVPAYWIKGETLSELTRDGYDSWCLFLAVVLEMERMHPEVFGTVDDPEEWAEKIESLTERQEILHRQTEELKRGLSAILKNL